MSDMNMKSADAAEMKELVEKLDRLSRYIQRLYHIRERLWSMSDRVFSSQVSENETESDQAPPAGYLQHLDALIERLDSEVTRCESALETLERVL